MSGSHYGSKAGRLRAAQSETDPVGEAASFPTPFDLTTLRSTEDAERLGPFLTLHQYLFLAGARAATARWSSATIVEHRHCKDPAKKAWLLQLCQEYAHQSGVLRECMECAPGIVLEGIAALRDRKAGEGAAGLSNPCPSVAKDSGGPR